ncbi:hypothetical protein B0T21DRAFT_281119 [Apiosordaria backusii]|uniref:Uncharacterized protein n=1 Tax=Apiosordaria backusii TaxID=314023 RepID=A0AA40ERR9_9PEZI|nr:hypothetical protein B0T21DRAFT_281119 [Apiosordaria backusii]
MAVVGWKPSADGYISTQNGGIEIELDGAVVCHIINLYSLTLEASKGRYRGCTTSSVIPLPNREIAKECKFSFGSLVWDTAADGQLHGRFLPGLESEMVATKQPLGEITANMEPGTIMVSYLNALNHGVSDSSFYLLPADAPLHSRVERLIACFESLWARGSTRGAPLIMTRRWFEDAARIKRRILTNGGNDASFLNDVVATVNTDDLGCGHEREEMEKIRKTFFFGSDSFTFHVLLGYRFPAISEILCMRRVCRTMNEICKAALLSYAQEPVGTWRHQLFQMKDQVLKVINLGPEIYLTQTMNVHLVEFTQDTELWHKTMLLGGGENFERTGPESET